MCGSCICKRGPLRLSVCVSVYALFSLPHRDIALRNAAAACTRYVRHRLHAIRLATLDGVIQCNLPDRTGLLHLCKEGLAVYKLALLK